MEKFKDPTYDIHGILHTHIPYVFACIPYTQTVQGWTSVAVCRHLWQRCLERGQGEFFIAAQTLRHGLSRHQDNCHLVTLWNRKFSFLQVSGCGAFKQAFPALPHPPVMFSNTEVLYQILCIFRVPSARPDRSHSFFTRYLNLCLHWNNLILHA